jgi:uncharacterized protein YvpB
MNSLYTIKDVLTTGFAIQWYVLILSILFSLLSLKGIKQIIKKQKISVRFSLLYCAVSILLITFSIVFFTRKPNLVHPILPMFDPVELSPDSPLVLLFDQPLDTNVQFVLNPPVAGTWITKHQFPGLFPGNTIVFTPSGPLEQGVEYTVSIENLSSFFGDDFSKSNSFLFVFQTSKKTQLEQAGLIELKESPTPQPAVAPQEFKLEVPLIKQRHTFGCFSAAGNMALAFYGVDTISEEEFIDAIGRDTTERNFVINVWGDPNKAVVGTIDGSGPGGYGVHWDPVVSLINKYRPAEVRRNWTIPELLAEVHNNHPVMVWWVNGVWPAKDVSWNLPSGEKVYTVNGVHVEVVTGWKGPIDDPLLIYTNDPWRGYRAYSKGQFENLWKWFDNTAVIVR